MDGVVVEGRFKWNRKDCVTQMPSKPRIVKTSDGKKETRVFDTALAQQRVMINAESITEAFQYELSDYPTALYSDGQMKDAGKWRFAKHLCNTWGKDSIVVKDTLIDPILIYDGGMLVHELISLWIRGKTFTGATADNYVSYLTRITRGTCEIIVVMDGYLGLSTKGHTQRKRNPTQSLDFVVQNDTVLDVSAIVFLSNPSNKQGFVGLLSEKINTRSRLTAKKCSGDADRSMITTALETVELHKPVILKADDTDVLVMCLAEFQTSGLFLKRGGKVYTIEQFRSRIEPPLVRQNLVCISCILWLRHHVWILRTSILQCFEDAVRPSCGRT